jgi:hypothetical protein
MKSCPFESNPEYIVMYHDGVMPPRLERRFAEHLTTCQSCMETLLNLQNDLFVMGNMGLEPVPGELARRTGVLADQGKVSAGRIGLTGASSIRGAIFKVIHGTLDMIGGRFGTGSFERIPAPAVRGKEQASYGATVLGVRVRLFYEESDRFSVELKGVRSRSVELQREGRPCERHIDLKRDNLVIEGLPRGEYTLSIDDTHVMIFTVQ